MAGKSPQSIDITQLGVPQLRSLTQQLEQEVELLSQSMTQLKYVQSKLVESSECLKNLTPEAEGQTMLAPLTASMYVSGELSDVSKVMVDIGTGYYVEMSVVKAEGYFKRRIDYLKTKMEDIQQPLQEKYRMKQAAMEVLQGKVQALAAQQVKAAT